ncbi:MAG: flagellar hook-length control protein FliK [Oscillospiraceae bacterium]|nr:flagellar hook-length control protein FliK [Oscillospiraceae bacterium]
MSEITMPSELMAAVNIFGGAADMTADGSADVSQGGSFGSILGLLMADAGQVDVPVQNVPEMPELSETEALPQLSLADIIITAAEGDDNAELPEVFTEKGIKAFIRSVSEFLDRDGAELSDMDIESLWNDVSPEERLAFAELLDAAAELSEDGLSDDEAIPADIFKSISRLFAKAAKKSDKKSDDAAVSDDKAVFMPVTDMRLFPIVTVSVERNDAAYADTETASAVEEITVQSGNSAKETSDFSVFDGMKGDIPAPADSEDVLTSELDSVFKRLYEAEPQELSGLCTKLADTLKASVSAKESIESDRTVIAYSDTASIPQKASAPEAEHIDFGRQNLQGFLARVNRTALSETDIPTEAVIPQDSFSGEISESISFSEDSDLSSQIMDRIDLYKDIFSDSFSEKEINMKLSPDELGGLEIRIRRSDKGFEITFTAEKAEAAELISNKTSELAEAMASRGIALKEISVSRQIVTSEADGSLTGNSFSSDGGLYGGAQGDGSDRHFSDNRGYSSDSSSEQQDNPADIIFNKEAKLWVSA